MSKSGSDITIGDYWGVENTLPEFDDDAGVSVVMLNTEKGLSLYGSVAKEDVESTYDDVIQGNPSLERSMARPPKRDMFFGQWKDGGVTVLTEKLTRASLTHKIKHAVKKYLLKAVIKKLKTLKKSALP
jgi:hypothetical protein